MRDEENDKKLRDAAENFHPAFDENAWKKMEKMLDENLPKEKDRKKILFFLPFILMLAGFIFYIFLYKNGNVHFHQSNVNENTTANTKASKDILPERKTINSINTDANSNEKTKTSSAIDIHRNQTIGIADNIKAANDIVSKENKNKISVNPVSSEQGSSNTLNSGKSSLDSKPTNSSSSVSVNNGDEEINDSKIDKKQQEKKDILPAISQTSATKPDQKKAKQKVKKQNAFADNFTIGFSAGPGVSAVGIHQGKVTLDLGISAGYRFWSRFEVQSGLFISKKIYSATPDQYTLPAGTSYYYLQKINANCNVIDIPLMADYYFDQKDKHAWIISAGFSSYLMKKENYNYFYKTPAGITYNKDRTIFNQNKHFFSVLDLSVGYEYLLDKHFSLGAQPYVDLPLTGIGDGRVKLKSAGILITIKAKPFLKKAK